MPRKRKPKSKADPGLSFIVIFENETSIHVPAKTREEAVEIAISAVEQVTGKDRDNLVDVREVLMCH